MRAGEDSLLERQVAEAGLAFCDDGLIEIVDDASRWLHPEEPDRINRRIVSFLEVGREAIPPARRGEAGRIAPILAGFSFVETIRFRLT